MLPNWQHFDLRHDYLLHFFWGFVLAFFFISAFGGWGVGITFLFALGKEIYDVSQGKGFDAIDILFTIAPAVGMYLLSIR